ncbi:MAG: PEP-CTERM sorting domain-containing protein [Crocosphaera sp.]|nr:PEP-CTERM sorting domain-containing protein [Crocosphaera sp.]
MNHLLIPLTNFKNQLQLHPFFVYLVFFLILGVSTIPNPSLAASEKTLEELFEEITATGIIDSLDYTNEIFIDIPTIGMLDLNFSLMLEEAGFAHRNIFGIYDTVTQNHFQIFAGEAKSGSQLSATLTSDSQLVIGDMTYDVEGPISFYLSRNPKKRSQTFYSNYIRRGIPQALVYEGAGQQLSFSGINTSFTDTDYIIAFEDQKVLGSDQDYNDLVIFAQTVLKLPQPPASPSIILNNDVAIPEPSLLSGLGMVATLGLARKRTSKR